MKTHHRPEKSSDYFTHLIWKSDFIIYYRWILPQLNFIIKTDQAVVNLNVSQNQIPHDKAVYHVQNLPTYMSDLKDNSLLCPFGELSEWPLSSPPQLSTFHPDRLVKRPGPGKVLVIPNFMHLWMMEANVLIHTFKTAKIILYPSSDLCLRGLQTIP